jgi:hypothetical protein
MFRVFRVWELDLRREKRARHVGSAGFISGKRLLCSVHVSLWKMWKKMFFESHGYVWSRVPRNPLTNHHLPWLFWDHGIPPCLRYIRPRSAGHKGQLLSKLRRNMDLHHSASNYLSVILFSSVINIYIYNIYIIYIIRCIEMWTFVNYIYIICRYDICVYKLGVNIDPERPREISAPRDGGWLEAWIRNLFQVYPIHIHIERKIIYIYILHIYIYNYMYIYIWIYIYIPIIYIYICIYMCLRFHRNMFQCSTT